MGWLGGWPGGAVDLQVCSGCCPVLCRCRRWPAVARVLTHADATDLMCCIHAGRKGGCAATGGLPCHFVLPWCVAALRALRLLLCRPADLRQHTPPEVRGLRQQHTRGQGLHLRAVGAVPRYGCQVGRPVAVSRSLQPCGRQDLQLLARDAKRCAAGSGGGAGLLCMHAARMQDACIPYIKHAQRRSRTASPASASSTVKCMHASRMPCHSSGSGAPSPSPRPAAPCRLPEDSGGAILMEFLNAFGRHFFLCDVCTRHFKGLLEKPSAKVGG